MAADMVLRASGLAVAVTLSGPTLTVCLPITASLCYCLPATASPLPSACYCWPARHPPSGDLEPCYGLPATASLVLPACYCWPPVTLNPATACLLLPACPLPPSHDFEPCPPSHPPPPPPAGAGGTRAAVGAKDPRLAELGLACLTPSQIINVIQHRL